MKKCDWRWAMDNDLTILHDVDLYDAMLDDCYPMINICGYEYAASDALKSVDPIAYREGMNNYIDSLVKGEAIYQLDDETLVEENPDHVLTEGE